MDKSSSSSRSSSFDSDDEDDDKCPSTVLVVAPATLEEGYSFEASIHNTSFLVVVPKGGVKEGQEFEVPYPTFDSDEEEEDAPHEQNKEPNSNRSSDEETPPPSSSSERRLLLSDDEHDGVPRGSWRTTLCSCCDVATQATFWMALLCLPVLYAQLLSRFGLSWKGQDGVGAAERSMTYNRVVLSFLFLLAVGGLLPLVLYPLFFCALLFYWYIGSQLRHSMRRRYEIPAMQRPWCCAAKKQRSSSGDDDNTKSSSITMLEDVCCVVCCTCCTAVQMARHSHNDKEYPGACCTTNGLEHDAPAIIV